MKLGLSMWSYFPLWRAGEIKGVADFIHEAKRVGAEGVELLDVFYRERDIDLERNDAFLALQETGLPVGVFSVSQNFAKRDPKARLEELDKIKFGIDEAEFYGAGVVRVFAGDVNEDITPDEALPWIVEGLSHASVYADLVGVKLALENHGKLAGRSDQVRKIIDEVREHSGSEALGANPDTGNFLLVNQPSHEAIKAVAPFAQMVHFKDFARTTPDDPEGHYTSLTGERYRGTALGEGEVNLGACIEVLKAGGFTKWLNLEYEGSEDARTAVPRSLQNARALMG